MKKTILLIFFSLIISTSLISQDNEGIIFLDNIKWSTVVDTAKKSKKLIFVDCYTSWCGPCKGMAKNVFTQKICGDFFNNNFICVKYDMEKGDGKILYEKYLKDIPGFPTILIIDANSQLILNSIVGYKNADKLIELVNNGLNGKTLESCEQRYNSGERSLSLIKDYTELLGEKYDVKKKEMVIREFIEPMHNDSLMNKELLNLYYNYLTDINNPKYKYVLNNLDKIVLKLNFDRNSLEKRLTKTISDEVKSIISQSDNINNIEDANELKSKSQSLKELLKSSNIKGFSALYAKLAINDYRIDNDINGLDMILDADQILNATNNDYFFKSDMSSYIIDNTKDKNLINKHNKYIQRIQESSKSSGIFILNYYDVIARALYKIGKKNEAKEAQLKFEEIYAKKIVEAKKLFGEEYSADMDEEYKMVVNKQRKFLRMQEIN